MSQGPTLLYRNKVVSHMRNRVCLGNVSSAGISNYIQWSTMAMGQISLCLSLSLYKHCRALHYSFGHEVKILFEMNAIAGLQHH